MDEIYEEADEETRKFEFVDNEMDSIIRQAFTGKKDYSFDRKGSMEAQTQVRLRFKRYNQSNDDSPNNSQTTLFLPNDEVILPFGSLEYSLDMVKSDLIKDEVVLRALGIKADRQGSVTTHLHRFFLI